MKLISSTLLGLWLTAFALSSGCTIMDQLENSGIFKRPTATIEGLGIAGMNAEGIDLLLNLGVMNPNSMGLNLGEVGYHLKVNGQSLIKGAHKDGLKLKSNTTSQVAIPLSFSFADLKKLSESLSHLDTMDYTLDTETKIRVPGLPALPISNTQAGTLPVPKVPEVSVSGLQIQQMNLASADLNLKLTVNNPNTFDILPKMLNYTLQVNGKQWAKGAMDNLPALGNKSQSTVNIPLSVGFTDIGMGMLKLLSGKGNELTYELKGGMKLDTGMKGLQNLDIPLNLSGQTQTN